MTQRQPLTDRATISGNCCLLHFAPSSARVRPNDRLDARIGNHRVHVLRTARPYSQRESVDVRGHDATDVTGNPPSAVSTCSLYPQEVVWPLALRLVPTLIGAGSIRLRCLRLRLRLLPRLDRRRIPRDSTAQSASHADGSPDGLTTLHLIVQVDEMGEEVAERFHRNGGTAGKRLEHIWLTTEEDALDPVEAPRTLTSKFRCCCRARRCGLRSRPFPRRFQCNRDHRFRERSAPTICASGRASAPSGPPPGEECPAADSPGSFGRPCRQLSAHVDWWVTLLRLRSCVEPSLRPLPFCRVRPGG